MDTIFFKQTYGKMHPKNTASGNLFRMSCYSFNQKHSLSCMYFAFWEMWYSGN